MIVNYKGKSLRKKFKKAIKAAFHSNSGVYYVNGNQLKKLPRNKNVNKYIKLIIAEVMQDDIILNNFSKKFIEENVVSILQMFYLTLDKNFNNVEFNKNYDEFISSFESKITNIIEDFEYYESIFPISNLKLESNLKIGNVEFFVIKDIDQFFNTNPKFRGYGSFNNFFIENQVYAKTTVYGSRDYANIKAKNDIKIALNVLKLFVNTHFSNFNLLGDTYEPYNQSFITVSPNKFYSGFKAYGERYQYDCTNKEIDKFRWELEYLSNILKDDNRSDFENRLLTSIFWFGEAISVKMGIYKKDIDNKHKNPIENFEFFELYPCLLNLVIALESIFIFGNENKSEAISDKVSKLIARKEYVKDMKEFLDNIYKMRSKLVHAGITYITKKDLEKLIKYVRYSIFTLAEINKEINDNNYYELLSFKEIYYMTL